MNREGLVGQIVLAVELYPFHQILGGDGVDLAAAVEGIYKGTDTDGGDRPRLVGGDIPVEVADDALRQVPGLDPAFDRHLRDLGDEAPMAADDPREQTLFGDVAEPLAEFGKALGLKVIEEA